MNLKPEELVKGCGGAQTVNLRSARLLSVVYADARK